MLSLTTSPRLFQCCLMPSPPNLLPHDSPFPAQGLRTLFPLCYSSPLLCPSQTCSHFSLQLCFAQPHSLLSTLNILLQHSPRFLILNRCVVLFLVKKTKNADFLRHFTLFCPNPASFLQQISSLSLIFFSFISFFFLSSFYIGVCVCFVCFLFSPRQMSSGVLEGGVPAILFPYLQLGHPGHQLLSLQTSCC